ncbi:MAG: hypothetical protein AAGI38_21180 [Bacteroidota bacterium]
MHQIPRRVFNQAFSQSTYQQFIADLNGTYDWTISFRVAESPVFVPREFKHQLLQASEQIIDVLVAPDYKEKTQNAIPPDYKVPHEHDHPLFFTIDMAVCEGKNGQLIPQLIELQGCPTIFCYQELVARKYREYFPIPDDYEYLFSGLTPESYLDLLREVILGGYEPQNVILLEVDPDTQHTRIDFLATEDKIGIKSVCISEVIKEDNNLFYVLDGEKTPIYRIYNRVIFDELVQRPDKHGSFRLTKAEGVEWAGHPNWFFQLSKYTLPLLDSPYVPKTWYLSDLKEFPPDLENYVLKPLYSFSGSGIQFDLKPGDLETIANPEAYILQRKVTYAPAIQTPDGTGVKCEIRLMYIWPEKETRPRLVANLARLSQGKMIGVKYNKDRDWVGGSVCFFEPG